MATAATTLERDPLGSFAIQERDISELEVLREKVELAQEFAKAKMDHLRAFGYNRDIDLTQKHVVIKSKNVVIKGSKESVSQDKLAKAEKLARKKMYEASIPAWLRGDDETTWHKEMREQAKNGNGLVKVVYPA